ncbi:MAG: sulfurtransferase [Deltaproteobacteria bacterium]|nr:sulfurtransferase [Deltaproteobacteria bacterium]
MPRTYPCGGGPVRLVSTDWLLERLGKGIIILDVQPNVHDYIMEHIPGAIYMNEGHFRTHVRHQPARFVPAGTTQPILRSAGLKSDVPVVVYTGVGAAKGWGDGLEQTMVAYSLARYGHNNVCVLDGGLDQWKKEGKPLAKEYAVAKPSNFEAMVREDYYIEYGEFRKIKDRDDVIVLDARPPEKYEGQSFWMKPGHIPGAVNLPWQDLMDEKNKALLRPEGEVMAILGKHGVHSEKTIICSCGTGREATNEFLLFKFYLGYNHVRLHEGAFTEWVSYPENSTVTGKNPR